MSTLALVLPDSSAEMVREIWAVLEARFGLSGVRQVPFPHVTLMAFENLPHGPLKNLMERASQATAPFMLETCGIGLFTEPAPVLYAPVVQSSLLHVLHRVIYTELEQLGGRIPEHYAPSHWIPHLTLAQGEPARGTYGEAMEWLMEEDLHLCFEVGNLTLFDWVGPRYEPSDRFPLLGRPPSPRG